MEKISGGALKLSLFWMVELLGGKIRDRVGLNLCRFFEERNGDMVRQDRPVTQAAGMVGPRVGGAW